MEKIQIEVKDKEKKLRLSELEGSFEDSQIFSNSKDDDEDDENLYKEHWKNKNLIDEFVKFNGEEIY